MRRSAAFLYRSNAGADTVRLDARVLTTRSKAMHDVSAIRVLDAVKALAFIGDLSMGQPTDHSPRTAWLAARLAAEAGLDGTQCDVVKEVSLLRWSGCTANA